MIEILERLDRVESFDAAIKAGTIVTPFNAELLVLPQQVVNFAACQTISFSRESRPDEYATHWFCCGTTSDWVGFMDDYGTFWAVDWC